MLTAILPVNYVGLDQFSDRHPLSCHSSEHTCQIVLENLPDGILLLTETGQSVYANLSAQKICEQLNPDTVDFKIPLEIWHACQVVKHNRQPLSAQSKMLTSEIWVNQSNQSTRFRIRVQWLPGQPSPNYFLVNLEDCQQAHRDRAISESNQYGLTDREAEVWILRRSGYSYQAIADQLYITANTVKKHFKNIHAKQKAYLDVDKSVVYADVTNTGCRPRLGCI
jgi:DNA-binding CsgD family transcriptional regulator